MPAQAQRPPTLQRCLKRLSDMVNSAEQEDGVAVWWPLAAPSSRDAPSSRRLLRLQHEEAVILNSRDKVSHLNWAAWSSSCCSVQALLRSVCWQLNQP